MSACTFAARRNEKARSLHMYLRSSKDREFLELSTMGKTDNARPSLYSAGFNAFVIRGGRNRRKKR